MQPEIEAMLRRYQEIWRTLGYAEPELPLDLACGTDNLYLEFSDGEYRYIQNDRGQEAYVWSTRDPEQMAEWIAKSVVQGIAAREVMARRFASDEERERHAADVELRLLARLDIKKGKK